MAAPMLAQQQGGAATDGPEPQHIFSIYFGGGSWYIEGQQVNSLDEFINSIPDILQYNITIHSHTDNIGGAEYNAWLSQMRSETVVQQLMQFNIPKELMEIKDFGQYNPVYDNNTYLGRLRNRRVDIILWPIAL